MSVIGASAAARASRGGKFGKPVDPGVCDQRICWRVPSEWAAMDPAPPREVIDAIRRVFGDLPIRLGMEHLPVLRALAVVGGAHYGRLAKLVEERGAIEVAIEGDEL